MEVGVTTGLAEHLVGHQEARTGHQAVGDRVADPPDVDAHESRTVVTPAPTVVFRRSMSSK